MSARPASTDRPSFSSSPQTSVRLSAQPAPTSHHCHSPPAPPSHHPTRARINLPSAAVARSLRPPPSRCRRPRPFTCCSASSLAPFSSERALPNPIAMSEQEIQKGDEGTFAQPHHRPLAGASARAPAALSPSHARTLARLHACSPRPCPPRPRDDVCAPACQQRPVVSLL